MCKPTRLRPNVSIYIACSTNKWQHFSNSVLLQCLIHRPEGISVFYVWREMQSDQWWSLSQWGSATIWVKMLHSQSMSDQRFHQGFSLRVSAGYPLILIPSLSLSHSIHPWSISIKEADQTLLVLCYQSQTSSITKFPLEVVDLFYKRGPTLFDSPDSQTVTLSQTDKIKVQRLIWDQY